MPAIGSRSTRETKSGTARGLNASPKYQLRFMVLGEQEYLLTARTGFDSGFSHTFPASSHAWREG
jgi:hypothetical protein